MGNAASMEQGTQGGNVPTPSKNNSPKNNSKNIRRKNKLPKNNSQVTNGASSPTLPESETGENEEAAIPNASVAGTVGNNNSRRPSNANSVTPEVASVEVNEPSQTGGRRKSRKSRKNRKSRKSRK